MSVSDKLSRLLDSSREYFDDGDRPDGGPQRTKKEKIALCHSVVDLVCNPQLRVETYNHKNVAEFNRLLGLSMELLLQTCEHADTDIRLVGDECLNRLIKGLMDSAIGRVIVELFKELRRNSSPRTLKAALSRFADLCHLVRVQKCRQYVQGLIPVLAQLLQRDEEMIQDCLLSTMPKLMQVFGRFMNDKDIKSLMTIPLARLGSSAATVRRMAASVLATVSQYSRKPRHFSSLLLQRLLTMVFPAPGQAVEGSLYLGVLMCLRHILGPNLLGGNCESNENSAEAGLIHDRGRPKEMSVTRPELELAFSLLLYCSQYSDHNVVTASLETLQQLLRQPPVLLRKWLMTAGALMGNNEAFLQSDVTSQLSLACQLCAGSGLLVRSGDSSLAGSMADLNVSLDSTALTDALISAELALDETDAEPISKPENLDAVPSPSASLNVLGGASPQSTCESTTPEPDSNACSSYWPWQLNEESRFRIPVVFTINLLCSSFLLSGKPTSLVNDRKVRVSVKSLALACVGAAVDLLPDVLQGHLYPLSAADEVPKEPQLVRDVLLFSKHSDQQLRGSTSLIVGYLVQSGLALGSGDFTAWSSQAAQTWSTDAFSLGSLIELLCSGLRDSSSMTSRMACLSVKSCLPALMESQQGLLSLDLLLATLQLKGDTYWLVKAELLEIVGAIDYQLLHFLETTKRSQPSEIRLSTVSIQDQVFRSVVLPLLGDSDGRVQVAAAQSLVRLVCRLYYAVDYPAQDILISMACQQTEFLFPVPKSPSQSQSFAADSSIAPLLQGKSVQAKVAGQARSVMLPAALEANLCRVLAALSQMMLSATSLTLQVGICGALKELSDAYPVHHHSSAWCRVTCTGSSTATSKVPGRMPSSLSGSGPATTPESRTKTGSVSSTMSKDSTSLPAAPVKTTASVAPVAMPVSPAKVDREGGEAQATSPPKLRRFFNKSAPTTSSQPSVTSTPEKPKSGGLFGFVNRNKTASTTSTSKENATAVVVAAVPSTPKDDVSSRRVSVAANSSPELPEIDEEDKAYLCQAGPLPFVVGLITATALAYDIQAHQNALDYSGRLMYCQVCTALSRSPMATVSKSQTSSSTTATSRGVREDSIIPWPSIKQRALVPVAHRLLKHLVRLLNVHCHVIDGKDLPPLFSREASKAQEKAGPRMEQVASAGPTSSVSPAKKPAPASALQAPGRSTPDSGKSAGGKAMTPKEQEAEAAVAESKQQQFTLGSFYHLTHYRKLYDTFSGAYRNFKSTVDANAGDKFGSFLETTLSVLSLLLEVACSSDILKHCEEIISFLTVTMQHDASTTLLCLQQLFRVVFEANASYNAPSPPSAATGLATHAVSMFSSCLDVPRKVAISSVLTMRSHLANHRDRLADVANRPKKELSQEEIDHEQRHLRRRFPNVPKCNMSHIASCINHFEPLVVRALQMYISTHSTSVQHQVLCLLMKLVNLRVNYAMLDADQKFVKSLMRQLSYIEQGHFMRDAGDIIPCMFQFLILLSYGRHNVKAIVSVPEIIQLCDGIMASGEMALSHAIPALEAIVNDLFVVQYAGSDEVFDQEMDTQRDAVLAMLLRLVQRCQGLRLLTTALRHSHSRPAKWQTRSQMVQAMLTSRLSKQQVDIDNMESVTVLRRVYAAVSPESLDITSVLKLLLFPVGLEASNVIFHRWLATVFVLLRVLVTNAVNEEHLLDAVKALGLVPSPFWCLPSSIKAPSNPPDTSDPARFLVYFLASVVCRAFHHIQSTADHVLCANDEHLVFVCQLAAHILHIWQVLLHSILPKLAESSRTMVQEELGFISQINDIALQLSHTQPMLLLSWAQTLLYGRFDHWAFWNQLLQAGHNRVDESREGPQASGPATLSCRRSHRLLQRGATALFSHFILKFASRSTLIFLKRHCALLVGLLAEPPILHLVKSVQTSQQMGSVFLGVLSQQAEAWLGSASWQHSLMQVLSAAHFGCAVTVLKLLLCTLLPSRRLLPSFGAAVARLAVQHVKKILDLEDEQLDSLLSAEDVDTLMSSCSLQPKHYSIHTVLPALRGLKSRLSTADAVTNTEQESSDSHLPAGPVTAGAAKEFYINLVKAVCLKTPPGVKPHRAAKLLMSLSLEELGPILNNQAFDASLLASCVSTGVRATLASLSSRETVVLTAEDFLAGNNDQKPGGALCENDRSHLLHTAILALFSRMKKQLELSDDGKLPACLQLLCHLGQAVASLCQHAKALPKKTCRLTPEQKVCAVRFTLHLVQALVESLRQSASCNWAVVTQCLNSLLTVLLDEDLFAELDSKVPVPHLCQLISAVHFLLETVVLPHGMHLPRSLASINDDDDGGAASAATATGDASDDAQAPLSRAREHACDMMLSLKEHMSVCKPMSMAGHSQPAFFMKDVLYKCVVCVCRLSVVYNYCRTPLLAWKMGWGDALALSAQNAALPPLPVDLLRERDLLFDFIWRSNVLGWTSRLQFEETWTSLLSMLGGTPQPETLPPEEQVESVQVCCLAIAGIASLLLANNLTPRSGHPSAGVHNHQPRQQELPFLGGKAGKRLCEVCSSVDHFLSGVGASSFKPIESFTSSTGITWKSDSAHYLQQSRPFIFTRNLDRPLSFTGYGFGQFSVNYLNLQCVSSDMHWESLHPSDLDADDGEEDAQVWRIQSGQVVPYDSIDINSCIQLMEDLISRWLSAATDSPTPLYLQLQAVRAATVMSDLFVELQHFTWLLKTFLELVPIVIGGQDDDILLQSLVVGLCRAAAVCRADGISAERVSHCVDTALRSSLSSTQVCGLQASLYVLESRSGADLKILLPSMIEYISVQLLGKQSGITPRSEQVLLSTWAAAFIIVERYSHELKDNTFVSRLVQAAVKLVLDGSESVTPSVQHSVLHGLQRLLLSFSLAKNDSQAVMQLAIKRLNMPHSECVASALSLLLTCMYTGKDVDRLIGINFEAAETDEEMLALRDAAFVSLEKVTILLDRMRKSFAFDAKIFASVVPLLLEDFVDTTQAMNKMVSEVLTSHQPHPVILAIIMAQAFNTLRRRGLLNEIRDWVILSLGSFIQRSPVEMAIWSLSCLFVTAANTPWIHGLFPFLLGRRGQLKTQDRDVFIVAAMDFFSSQNLLPDQRGIFKEAFELHSSKSSLYQQLLDRTYTLI